MSLLFPPLKMVMLVVEVDAKAVVVVEEDVKVMVVSCACWWLLLGVIC